MPRRQPSIEAIEAKRRSLEKGRLESAAESGDDEDEELGNMHLRTRSPRRSVKRTSKLGTEMMRTNSQGSVITADELPSASSEHAAGQPREAPIAELPAAEVEASGHLTPPTVFPREPGDHSEVIDMDAGVGNDVSVDPDATPRPQQQLSMDPDPTPRASTSPQHQD